MHRGEAEEIEEALEAIYKLVLHYVERGEALGLPPELVVKGELLLERWPRERRRDPLLLFKDGAEYLRKVDDYLVLRRSSHKRLRWLRELVKWLVGLFVEALRQH